MKKKYHYVAPVTANQKKYLESLHTYPITFACGPAGTGKTLLALQHGLQLLDHRHIHQIYYVRNEVPVDIGCKNRGALPGDIDEKSQHMLHPIKDNLLELTDEGNAEYLIRKKKIQFLFVEDLRGRSLANSYIIVDEAQNIPPNGMLTILTRRAKNTNIVFMGDSQQKDLNSRYEDGLLDAVHRLGDMPEIGLVFFEYNDIQRNELNSEIIRRYS